MSQNEKGRCCEGGYDLETDTEHIFYFSRESRDLEFEKVASTAYAVMLNTLDPLAFVPLLAETVSYCTQNETENFDGRERVVKYFIDKMAAIEKGLPELKVFAELGEWNGRSCVVVAQGKKAPPCAIVVCSVKDKKVKTVAIQTYFVHSDTAHRLGIYPETLGGKQ